MAALKFLVQNAGGTGYYWVSLATSGASTISDAVGAVAGNTIDNTNYSQEWQWSTLAAGTGFKISSASTLAAGNTQTLFNVDLSGTSGTAGQTTHAAKIANSHIDAGTNVALRLSSTNGANNYALIVDYGLGGFGLTAPTASLHTQGLGTTNSTYSFKSQNSVATLTLGVADNGYISAGLAIGSLTFGYGSGFKATLAGNTFVGVGIANSITSGIDNTAYGFNALKSITTGSYNTAIGMNSIYSSATCSYNTAVGWSTLYANDGGINCVAIGYQSMYSNTQGSQNVAVGVQTLYGNIDGYNNTAIGNLVLYTNSSGYWNTGVGDESLLSNTTGYHNTAVGTLALNGNTVGAWNTAVGVYSLYLNTSGIKNTATGWSALYSNTTGNNNVANGYQTLYSNTFGGQNVAIGTQSLYSNTTGSYNIALGMTALNANTTGADNIGIGYNSLSVNTTGNQNLGIGSGSLVDNTTGSNNVSLGFFSGALNSTGSRGVFIGTYAGAYETASDAFYLNNQDRTDLAGDKAKSLMYGVFNATALSQTLTLNLGTLTLLDGANIVFGTTTGTKIGTAASQKIGFYNTTPIVQPTTGVATSAFAANTSGIADDTATFGGYKISQIVKALQLLGLLA